MHTRRTFALPFSRVLPLVFGILLIASVAPQRASAAVSVNVRQVLPPNAQTCPSLGVSDIRPYIYDGNLHSFDISTTDPSYVAVGGTVGDAALGFRTMTRWRNSDGSVRIHVDIENTRLDRAVPVSITLLSAHAGGHGATCLGAVSGIVGPITASSGSKTTSTNASGVSVHAAQKYSGHAATPVSPSPYYKKDGWVRPASNGIPGSGAGSVGSSGLTLLPAGIVTSMHALGNTCAVPHGPSRLWSVLIVLYAAFALWAVLQSGGVSDRRPVREWLSAAIA